MDRNDIIRVSSFCSRRKYVPNTCFIEQTAGIQQSKRKTHGNKDNPRRVCENNLGSIQVSLSILKYHPRRKQHQRIKSKIGSESKNKPDICFDHDQRRRKKTCKKSDCVDEFSTVYVDSPDFLISLEVFEGQICKLVLKNENDGNHIRWIPVFLKVLPKTYPKVKADSSTQQYAPHPTIYVPPCIAASLDICHYIPFKIHEGLYVSPFASYTNMTFNENKIKLVRNDQIITAKKAVIREIGVPPSEFLPTFGLLTSNPSKWRSKTLDTVIRSERLQEDGRRSQNQLDNLKMYFFDDNKKPKKRLMKKGTIFSVVDNGKKFKHSCVRFYELVQVGHRDQSYSTSNETIDHQNSVYFLSPETELVLTSRNEAKQYPLRPLPQSSLALEFHSSLFTQTISKVQSKNDTNHNPVSMINSLKSHHCLDLLIKAIFLRGRRKNSDSSNIKLGNHILHIIGQKDNHIHECLQAAADIVGMRLLHIDGLAAFAYKHNMSSTQPLQVSGLLRDKLLGISSAFKVAISSSPIIIHICNFDEELSNIDDKDSKYDEEQRFLQCLRDEIMSFYLSYPIHHANDRSFFSSLENFGIPPILIVISTSKNLSDGPIASILSSHQPISISKPNEFYTKQLWNDDSSFDQIKSHLSGLSAEEIEFVNGQTEKQIYLFNESDKVAKSKSDTVKHIIYEIESGVYQHLRLNPSKLTSSLVQNTHWEDIGGLAHVRDEIIDVIELPLRYPDLFEDSKRCGVLLFGPPGSGKTLIAKAIATECGLPFLSVKGPELLGSYVGESEANIRSVFASARDAAMENATKERKGSAILFFDELDSLAPRRGSNGDGAGVMERVVASLLGELDKGSNSPNPISNESNSISDETVNIFVIGATNRPDLLDPALLRPGRFDRLVYLGLAKENSERASILAALTRKFNFEQGLDPMAMAMRVIDDMPKSLSGADFSAVASGAMMRSLQRLCDEADEESSHKKGDARFVEDVILNWDKEKQTPLVTAEDLIVAAQCIQPSVTTDDLKHYERLKDQFTNTA